MGMQDWNRRRMAGITLIELMVVVMVIGVLGIIAMPSYRQYVMRAQRTEAKTALLRLQTNQERYYLLPTTHRYGTINELIAANLLSAATTENGSYRLTIASADFASGYTATATPVAGARIDMSADAMCTTFTLTAQGVKGATGSNPTSCW